MEELQASFSGDYGPAGISWGLCWVQLTIASPIYRQEWNQYRPS